MPQNNSLIKVRNTMRRYSLIWSKYNNLPPPAQYHFDTMQELIPEKIVRGTLGLEIGCGCGWDTHIMAKNNHSVRIIGLDISDGVYTASRINSNLKNVNIIKGSAADIPLKDVSCDFIYSFGVLHHMPDYRKGFLEISRVLKPGSPCFLYLYEDHSDNKIKYFAVKMTAIIRKVTTRIPPRMLYLFSCLLSPLFVIIFGIPAKIFKEFKLTYGLYEKMPFNFATSLFSIRGDIYDRFSAPVEHRFSQRTLYDILNEYNFHDVNIKKLKTIAGWVVWGYKNNV